MLPFFNKKKKVVSKIGAGGTAESNRRATHKLPSLPASKDRYVNLNRYITFIQCEVKSNARMKSNKIDHKFCSKHKTTAPPTKAHSPLMFLLPMCLFTIVYVNPQYFATFKMGCFAVVSRHNDVGLRDYKTWPITYFPEISRTFMVYFEVCCSNLDSLSVMTVVWRAHTILIRFHSFHLFNMCKLRFICLCPRKRWMYTVVSFIVQ